MRALKLSAVAAERTAHRLAIGTATIGIIWVVNNVRFEFVGDFLGRRASLHKPSFDHRSGCRGLFTNSPERLLRPAAGVRPPERPVYSAPRTSVQYARPFLFLTIATPAAVTFGRSKLVRWPELSFQKRNASPKDLCPAATFSEAIFAG